MTRHGTSKTEPPARPPTPDELRRIAARMQDVAQPMEGRDDARIQDIYDQLGIAVADKRSAASPAQRSPVEPMPADENPAPATHGGLYGRIVWWCDAAASHVGTWVVERTHVSSVSLSLTAAVLFGATGVFIYTDHLLYGAFFLVLAGAVEAIDASAALCSPAPRRDVYIDYMVDRLTDIFLFGAIAASYSDLNPLIAWLSAGTLVCSLLSSYGRAQADALRFSSRSHFNRAERLICVFSGLLGTAMLHILGYHHVDLVLSVTLFFALAFTAVTLCERFFSTITSAPYTEVIVQSWDDDSIFPRLLDVLGSQEGFTVLQRSGKERAPLCGDVVYIDRYKDRTRVRIFKSTG